MTPAECRALVADLAELQEIYARRREASARKPEPLAKARPAPRPAARRPAPPPVKPAPAKPVPADWLDRIKADQRAVETDIFRTKLRAASAQVGRGEVSAVDAARLDAINHRATALGVWE